MLTESLHLPRVFAKDTGQVVRRVFTVRCGTSKKRCRHSRSEYQHSQQLDLSTPTFPAAPVSLHAIHSVLGSDDAAVRQGVLDGDFVDADLAEHGPEEAGERLRQAEHHTTYTFTVQSDIQNFNLPRHRHGIHLSCINPLLLMSEGSFLRKKEEGRLKDKTARV